MSISGVYIETIMNFPYRMDGWRSNEVELILMRDIFLLNCGLILIMLSLLILKHFKKPFKVKLHHKFTKLTTNLPN